VFCVLPLIHAKSVHDKVEHKLVRVGSLTESPLIIQLTLKEHLNSLAEFIYSCCSSSSPIDMVAAVVHFDTFKTSSRSWRIDSNWSLTAPRI
jgi:hypothetical protein